MADFVTFDEFIKQTVAATQHEHFNQNWATYFYFGGPGCSWIASQPRQLIASFNIPY